MENYSYPHPSTLSLGFQEMAYSRYVYSVIVLLVYMIIVVFNSSVITTVVLYKSLYEPMYIFISTLCVNGLYGSSSFFPSLFVDLCFKIDSISYIGCVTQVFCIHTFLGCEMTILTVMAYDRYVCICNPLRYNNIMTLTSVAKLVVSAWMLPIVLISILIVLTIRLPLCDRVILKIYCDNWSIVRLSCIDTTVNNGFGLFISSIIIGLMLILIICSYVQILKVCMRSSKDFQAKALQTCTPHIITITNFVSNLLFELFMYRFSPTEFPYELRIFMSVQLLVGPPIINPLIYGLKLKEIRMRIGQLYHFQSRKVNDNKF
ncbi:olfactory receptor 52D1-like [Bufo gargarizans]|uniref:olfactory receptor 52D1-like n=1 Tax=Bufo gargarizans TaxID=30331 RepID=UPI001CF2CE4D|nr:olfactory receptor 52D1-like [Bufo gargarizans]